LALSLAMFKAAKEPTGPPPTTMAFGMFFINCTLSAINISLLDKLDASLSPRHGSGADLAADLQPHQNVVEVFVP